MNTGSSTQSTNKSRFELSEKQKIITALLIAIVIVGGFFFTVQWFRNPNFRNFVWGRDSKDVIKEDPLFQNALNQIKQSKINIDPNTYIYQTIKLEDLPVYPKAWVDTRFIGGEKNNALISGSAADPDGDGLSNKQEYLYGSNPKNKYSLCGKSDGQDRCRKTDKENVDSGISPLTGLSLEKEQTITLKRQDFAVLDKIQNSFETSAREGVDFPTLYQLSRQVDLSNQVSAVTVKTGELSRENLINYINLRVEILEDFIDTDEFSSFSEIYTASKPEDLETIAKKYRDQKTKLEQITVPQGYEEPHKGYIFVFQKLVEMVEQRKQALVAKTILTAESKKKSKEKAVEVVWAYRWLNEALDKQKTINE